MVKLSLAPVILLASCGGRALPRGGAGVFSTAACGTHQESFTLQLAREVDLLFVIDNSETMAGEQDQLQGRFDAMIGALADMPGGFPDTHIGVISTDLGTGPYATEQCETIGGDAGRLQAAPQGDCAPPGDAYIRVAGTGTALEGNVADVGGPGGIDLGDVQAAFRCIALLGTDGCRFEQPLEAARTALRCDESVCPNPSFLRPDSLLVVVFLGDEDDCSASDPDFFDPTQNSASEPLGYFSGFRCFEFGVECEEPILRTGGQALHACAPDPASAYLHPIESYRDFFSALRPHGLMLLTAITGPYRAGDVVHTERSGEGPVVNPSCQGAGDSSAYPAIRIHDLVRRFESDGLVLADETDAGICGDDLGPALQRIGEAIRGRVSPGCLLRPLVRADDRGDPQPVDSPEEASCAVTETVSGTTITRERCAFESEAPTACSAAEASPGALASSSSVPCWYLCDAGPPSAGGCAYRWEIRFCRDAACQELPPDPADVRVTAECQSCEPGELCGDGRCQDSLGETEESCADDCL